MTKYTVRSREYKLEAVRLWQSSDKSAKEVEKELGLRHGSLYEWKHHLIVKGGEDDPDPEGMSSEQARIRQLERENKRLRQEAEILKKAVAIFSKPSP